MRLPVELLFVVVPLTSAALLLPAVGGLGVRELTYVTLLGAAGESLGMDRHLKVNTAKRRTHSLFRQGCMLYELIPSMPEVRLRPLVGRFYLYIKQHPCLKQTFSCV